MELVVGAAHYTGAKARSDGQLGVGAIKGDIGDPGTLLERRADDEDVIGVLVRGRSGALNAANNGEVVGADGRDTADLAGRGARRAELDAIANRELSTVSDRKRGVARTELTTLVDVGGGVDGRGLLDDVDPDLDEVLDLRRRRQLGVLDQG